MGPHEALADHMRGFQVAECLVQQAVAVQGPRLGHLAFKSGFQLGCHGLPPFQFNGHGLAWNDRGSLHLATSLCDDRACRRQPQDAHHSRHGNVWPTGSSTEHAKRSQNNCQVADSVIPGAEPHRPHVRVTGPIGKQEHRNEDVHG